MGTTLESRFEQYCDLLVSALHHEDRDQPARWYIKALRWTELGARQVGIVQSLLATCRLHDIDPYDYFVDVLQRVSQHPASKVDELTPRAGGSSCLRPIGCARIYTASAVDAITSAGYWLHTMPHM